SCISFRLWRTWAGNNAFITQTEACWQLTFVESHDVPGPTSGYHQVPRENNAGLAGRERSRAYGQRSWRWRWRWRYGNRFGAILKGADVTSDCAVDVSGKTSLVGDHKRPLTVPATARVTRIDRWTASDQRM